jgi:2-phosphosulfolactate phosphatase
MQTHIYQRHECLQAKGLCVVIDVLRAFTTAAYAFAAGAQEIVLVSSVEEAFQKQKNDPSLILMGEEEGKPIKGFHLGNSPAEVMNHSLFGHRIVQRTSAGTQGVVNCRHADQLLLASFVVAEATLKRILEISPSHVSFIVTGVHNGDEDLALAEYMQIRLMGKNISPISYLDRVRKSPEGRIFADPSIPEFSQEDLELALKVDCFSFSMEVKNYNGTLIAKRVSDSKDFLN